MTRRVLRAEKRPYHGFPWTAAAIRSAVAMAEPGPGLVDVSLRGIAADLFARGLVAHKPSAKTVARMLDRECPTWRARTRGAA